MLSPIEVARRTGRSLVIAGIVQDEGYFRAEVLPHVDGAVAAVAQVGTFDRPAIRAIAVERFGVGRMVAEYAALYERVLAA